MDGSSPSNVTRLLLDWSRGDRSALDRLMPLVYAELRVLADRSLRHERTGHTLQGTALVHEAYLKMVDQRQVRWQDRAHFFAVAAQLMRRILVDHARRHRAAKRGSGKPGLPPDEADVPAPPTSLIDWLALDRALDRLAALDERQARIVELRFFGGLTIEETAEVLQVSPATVKNEWSLARGWLYRELQGRMDR
ncbi:MAG TPA: sigma-70 family RNA polymerase sigma factor [Vicinamibacterales bacterium]|nr:sigma-70 family RNA polymerase sigma factor [Vicinamibacterales bacterium]